VNESWSLKNGLKCDQPHVFHQRASKKNKKKQARIRCEFERSLVRILATKIATTSATHCYHRKQNLNHRHWWSTSRYTDFESWKRPLRKRKQRWWRQWKPKLETTTNAKTLANPRHFPCPLPKPIPCQQHAGASPYSSTQPALTLGSRNYYWKYTHALNLHEKTVRP